MDKREGESLGEALERIEKRIIALLAFGVFAVDGDQAEVDRQIKYCEEQRKLIIDTMEAENDQKAC